MRVVYKEVYDNMNGSTDSNGGKTVVLVVEWEGVHGGEDEGQEERLHEGMGRPKSLSEMEQQNDRGANNNKGSQSMGAL